MLLENLTAELVTEQAGPVETLPGISLADLDVDDVVHDSRSVAPGSVFCAVPGLTVDGHDFLASAQGHGAVAAIVERFVELDSDPEAMPQLRVVNVRQSMAHAAAIVHRHPSRELSLVGITGTNGKTTTTQLLSSIVQGVGRSCAVIGTLDGIHTTPESTDLQRQLRHLVDERKQIVALEVSSHALHQRRVDATSFAVAAFSNLTPDHLNYHHNMEAYFEAKAELFDGRAGVELINIDDPWGQKLAARRPDAQHLSLAAVEIIDERIDGTDFMWRGQQTSVSLPGKMNVANALMAAEAGLVLGLEPAAIASALSQASPVDGRMQTVGHSLAGQPTVVVDYSHTPDSIDRALATLRSTMTHADGSAGTLSIVFGCGGDRDRQKRPLMSQAAAKGADRVYLTNDNPRTEEPLAIIDDALTGFSDRSMVVVEPDRRQAITRAIMDAGPGDVVLVAGKGHEKTQTIGVQKFPFDDVEVARQILEELAT